MTDIVLSVAAKVAEYLVAPVGRQCGYVIFTNSYVGQLKEELEKLENARQRVIHSVDEAQNNMREIRCDVNWWQNNAETIADKARDVLDNDARAMKTCFCRCLPNPKERYCLGREAKKTVQAVQALISQGRFERIYYESAPPPGYVTDLTNVDASASDWGDTITDSRASIFQGIMNALDDEKHKVIGIHGPGGVGKTTMLEVIQKKLRKEGRPFHMIVKSKVSHTPDLKKIQDDIAYAFGLNLKEEPSEAGRRDLLFRRLQKDPGEKVLVVLDDLWTELDLRAIGIPTGDESKGCQVLLTSRYEDVLQQKMGASPIFHLTGLEDHEALTLFEKTVGDRLRDDEQLKAMAPQVVKKLAGLPLLIISVASTLKYSDVSAWNKALIERDDPKVETIVKLSYDHLKSDDAKTLFLLCGLIGGTIQVETLLVLGMGLGLFEEFRRTMQDSRDRLNTLLDELCSACLLLDCGSDKNNVTIHDLYSKVVVSNAFTGQNSLMIDDSNHCTWPKKEIEKCWACLVNFGNDRLAELKLRRFPNVNILMLSEQYNMGDCSRMDFTYMKELRALYLCSMGIASLPSSMEILRNLRSLSINCDVEDVANLGKLKALQILNFTGSTISRLPKEIGELMNLRSLNLSRCYQLKIIEPGTLKGLINLEELRMKESFDRWMGKDEIMSDLGGTRLAELKNLTKLAFLEISIPRPIILLEDGDLPFGNLIRFSINIGDFYLREVKDLRNMDLNLDGQNSILSIEWFQKTLQKTQNLHLEGLIKFKNMRGFHQLRHLYIRNNPSIKYVASSSNGASTILESLFLKYLINLEKICHDLIAPECFNKLKVVNVTKCNRLEYLWSLSEMQRLVSLEDIRVCCCNSMRAIVTVDLRNHKVDADQIVELPKTRHLELARLPIMTSFYTEVAITSKGAPIQGVVIDEKGRDEGAKSVPTTSYSQDAYSSSFFDRKVSLPILEELKIDSVGPFRRIWHGELPGSSFCKLAILTIENCSHLLDIFPSTIIERLHNLERVHVSDCPSLESLFDCGSLDSDTKQTRVLLPNLVSVRVERCPSLKLLFDCGSPDSNMEPKILLLPKLEQVCVDGAGRLRHVLKSDSQMVLGFPSIKTIIVDNCSELRYLVPNYTATTLENLKSLWIGNCEQIKEVVPQEEGGQSMTNVMSFTSLTYLCILRCPNFEVFIPSPTSAKRPLGAMAEENDESSQPLFNEMVIFPNIKTIKIEGVQCKELWNDQIPDDSFCKLESLELRDCDNLQRIAPSYIWKRLQRCLEILEVRSCRSIEIIYESDGTVTESGKLRRLTLSSMENLRRIWQYDGLPNVLFPNLRSIDASSCPHLETIFPTLEL